jgi:hypothetical protein
MPLGNPQSGIGFGAEFQSSALPWVTSALAPSASAGPVRYNFPTVSRFISLANLGTGTQQISVGFTPNGMMNNNKYILNAGQSLYLDWRVAMIFIQGEIGTPLFSLGVGVTTIQSRNMPVLTGTLSDGTPGWPGVG